MTCMDTTMLMFLYKFNAYRFVFMMLVFKFLEEVVEKVNAVLGYDFHVQELCQTSTKRNCH